MLNNHWKMLDLPSFIPFPVDKPMESSVMLESLEDGNYTDENVDKSYISSNIKSSEIKKCVPLCKRGEHIGYGAIRGK